VGNFLGNSPQSSTQDTVNSRLDHKFNDSHTIFLRYDWFQRYNYFGDPYGNGLSPVSNHQRLPGDNTMLDHTWVITPTVVLDHHFVYAHQESNRIPNTLGFNPTSIGFNGNVTAGLQTTTYPTISSASRLSGLGPLSGNESDGGTTYEYVASTIVRWHRISMSINWSVLPATATLPAAPTPSPRLRIQAAASPTFCSAPELSPAASSRDTTPNIRTMPDTRWTSTTSPPN
jgi:hypothetical protein